METSREQALRDAGVIPPVDVLEVRAQKEAAERPERLKRLREKTETLFPGEAFAPVRAAIEESFRVPQVGQYHNEGMFMDAHLALALRNIEEIARGNFPNGTPEDAKPMMKKVVEESKELLEKYVLLHDIAKKDCLTVAFADGTSRAFTWDEWNAFTSEEVKENPVAFRAFCSAKGIEDVSYFQATEKRGESSKAHGPEGRRMLENLRVELGVPLSVLTAIEKHEVGFQFNAVSAKTYKNHLSGLAPEDRALAVVASYLDTSASLRENGEPDLNNVSFLFDSKHNFEMIEETEKRILGNGEFDQKKAQKFFAGLYGADRRFDEPLDGFITRAEKACRPTEYDIAKVKNGFLPLVTDGTLSQIEADEIADAIERKDVASVGRKFGKKMSKISPVLRASEMA